MEYSFHVRRSQQKDSLFETPRLIPIIEENYTASLQIAQTRRNM
nr:MAG TPA: hypothetical protein [Caudoviricetes sp.]